MMHRKTRPIAAKFVQLKEQELVQKAAFSKLKEQNRNDGINEQFPREINE